MPKVIAVTCKRCNRSAAACSCAPDSATDIWFNSTRSISLPYDMSELQTWLDKHARKLAVGRRSGALDWHAVIYDRFWGGPPDDDEQAVVGEAPTLAGAIRNALRAYEAKVKP